MIRINLFNKFTIEIDGIVYDMHEELGNQLTEVMAAIVYYYKGGMSKQKLIDFFWNESENPENALKYSVFRLRDKLSKIDKIKDYDWIVTKKNGYTLNRQIDFVFDVDEFNKIIASNDYSITNVNKLIGLYNGGFLLDNSQLYTYNIRMFYEDLFVNFVLKSAKEYFALEKYEIVLDIMEKAFIVIPLDEDLIYTYLKTLIQTKRYNAALKYYQKLSEEYFEAFNRPLSDRTDNLFHAYVENDENSVEDIDDVVRILRTTEKTEGPMYVTFLHFKQFFERVYRQTQRSRKKVSVVLVKLQTDNQIDAKMNHLKKVVDRNLRSSDVYTKLNSEEYLFLFVVKDDFDVFTIMSKLQASFYLKYKRTDVKFHFYNKTAEEIQGENK